MSFDHIWIIFMHLLWETFWQIFGSSGDNDKGKERLDGGTIEYHGGTYVRRDGFVDLDSCGVYGLKRIRESNELVSGENEKTVTKEL